MVFSCLIIAFLISHEKNFSVNNTPLKSINQDLEINTETGFSEDLVHKDFKKLKKIELKNFNSEEKKKIKAFINSFKNKE